MAKCVFNDGTVISDYGMPYFVAEVNTSHNGDVETAKLMVDKAVETGCDCVKFQSWTADSLYSKTYYKNNPIAKRMVSKLSLNETQLLELSQYCNTRGIHFTSTPYSRSEVDFLLEKCNVPYIKIASMDINNYGFIDYIARTGIPIVLSTGMSTLEEISQAVSVIERVRNYNVCLLHCVSVYPTPLIIMNLRNIENLRKDFPDYPIGFSDHSLGTEISAGATALGAALIEKHLTLDGKKIGMDNQMALEPEEMAALVANCQSVHYSLGSPKRAISVVEKGQSLNMRRSIVVNKDLKVGTTLTIYDFDVKRPGTGLPPEKISELVGRTLVRDMETDTLITEGDYE